MSNFIFSQNFISLFWGSFNDKTDLRVRYSRIKLGLENVKRCPYKFPTKTRLICSKVDTRPTLEKKKLEVDFILFFAKFWNFCEIKMWKKNHCMTMQKFINHEPLPSSIKQSTQQRGKERKGRTKRERGPKSKPQSKTQTESERRQRNKV
jgi:hypothetical protein